MSLVVTRFAGSVAVVFEQAHVSVLPVPLYVHDQDCLAVLALVGDDWSSRMTICSGFWLYGDMMKLPAFMMSVMSD